MAEETHKCYGCAWIYVGGEALRTGDGYCCGQGTIKNRIVRLDDEMCDEGRPNLVVAYAFKKWKEGEEKED